MTDDTPTGARTAVEIVIPRPRETTWDLLTDIARMATRSPESVGADWIGGATGPVAGARFTGRNVSASGHAWTVTGVVTAADRPDRFAWVVLDGSGDPERPGSLWAYDLLPGDAPATTLVRHSFTHGPGMSGFRQAIAAHPDRSRTILTHRLTQLNRNMRATLDALIAELDVAGATSQSPPRP